MKNESLLAGFLGLASLMGCGLVGGDAQSSDDCAGTPFGPGYTVLLNPGTAIHEGYYSSAECSGICGSPMSAGCAPVLEQRSQPQFRCGAPPPAHCGPRDQPRPNVPGPCDSNGFDKDVSSSTFTSDNDAAPVTMSEEMKCFVACGGLVKTCSVPPVLPRQGTIRIRCGEQIPPGCPSSSDAGFPHFTNP